MVKETVVPAGPLEGWALRLADRLSELTAEVAEEGEAVLDDEDVVVVEGLVVVEALVVEP